MTTAVWLFLGMGAWIAYLLACWVHRLAEEGREELRRAIAKLEQTERDAEGER